MSQPKIIVEGINCNNDRRLRELLYSVGYRGCFTWTGDTSLEVFFLGKNVTPLIDAIENLGLTATLKEGE